MCFAHSYHFSHSLLSDLDAISSSLLILKYAITLFSAMQPFGVFVHWQLVLRCYLYRLANGPNLHKSFNTVPTAKSIFLNLWTVINSMLDKG